MLLIRYGGKYGYVNTQSLLQRHGVDLFAFGDRSHSRYLYVLRLHGQTPLQGQKPLACPAQNACRRKPATTLKRESVLRRTAPQLIAWETIQRSLFQQALLCFHGRGVELSAYLTFPIDQLPWKRGRVLHHGQEAGIGYSQGMPKTHPSKSCADRLARGESGSFVVRIRL